jgi:hypothetical protein
MIDLDHYIIIASDATPVSQKGHEFKMALRDLIADIEEQSISNNLIQSGINRELEYLAKLIGEYVSATKCGCEKGIDTIRGHLPETQCWHCIFKYNLKHLESARRKEIKE